MHTSSLTFNTNMSRFVEKRALALCKDVCMIRLVFSLQFCLLIFLCHVVVVFHFAFMFSLS